MWDAIFAWLTRAAPGIAVIQRDQNGRLPDRPFVAAKVIAEAREGMASIGELQEDGTVSIQQGVVFTVSVAVFGPNAFDLAQDIRDSVELISMLDLFYDNGLAFVDVINGPVDLAAIASTGWEGRAQVDVRFRTNREILDNLGIIEHVELSGQVDSIAVGPEMVEVVTP